MTTDTSEKAFQNDIIAHLVSTGYHQRGNHNYNRASCIDHELTLKFIQDTQPKEWKKFQRVYGEQSERKFFYRLVNGIDKKGTINVLRNGFKDVGCHFELFYPKPNNKKNPDLFEKFEKNIFSVIDELEYEQKEDSKRLDLVISVNGLPIITIELKDTFSQGVERAIKQYKEDRDPREKIFQRCFVHFAMSDEKIFMATKLEGWQTRFLPFNKGLENPDVKTDYKTSYLYNDILQINKLSKLISNFIYMEKNEDTRAVKPIFPRYHQLDCANLLLADAKPGKNYLIMPDEYGHYYPFHTYTMKQAIEEGFILDVLKNYLTYPTYFKLVKKIQDDPEYDEKKAKRLLRNFVEKHPVAIARKTEIMLNHFMSSTIHKINGKAKAMVVTRSRLHAVLYKKAFDRLIKENNYPIKTLVAFTGVVRHDEQEYTENSMNDMPPKKEIRNAFEEDQYKILIVANKFQTGFDQPLLHTMYVDKMLNGITAVQTLCRLNRIHQNKNDTLILDFANKTEVIQKAFQPYYETTFLEEATDPHKLYELEEKLLDYQVFDKSDIETFVKAWKNGEPQPKLHNILSPVVNEFRQKTKKEQVEFKKTLRRYQNIYSFLSQLIPFSDVNLEKIYIFNKFLNKKLPTINNPLPFSVLQDVDIDSSVLICVNLCL